MPSTPTYKNLDALIEQPDSGAVASTRTGRTTTKVYVAKYATAVAAIKSVGTVGTGDLAGYTIEASNVTPMRPGLGKLVDVWTAGGDSTDPGVTLPPDEVGVAPGSINPRVELHPYFSGLVGEEVTVEDKTFLEFTAARNAASAADPDERAKWYDSLSALGQEMVNKMERGNETFYLATLRYSWVTHFWTTPVMTRGGFIELPAGPLAGYFVSDLAWLREADDLQYSAGLWRLTRTWLGAPDGHWDSDLYS